MAHKFFSRNNILDSTKIALVVGSLLCLVNLSEVILSLNFTVTVVIKIALNFLIPFSVASYSKFQLLVKNDYE